MEQQWLRLLLLLLATAIVVRVAWCLIVPMLPVIAVALAATVIWQLWRWRRDRW
jgi:hypothetical protein